jgi:hypothetical protein
MVNTIGHLSHLHARDTFLLLVSRTTDEDVYAPHPCLTHAKN